MRAVAIIVLLLVLSSTAFSIELIGIASEGVKKSRYSLEAGYSSGSGWPSGARGSYYEYSGRVVRAKGSDLPFLLGKEPREVVFAYFDGRQWHMLPARIYDGVVETNTTTIYIVPARITRDTVIEFRLPSLRPALAKPATKVPEFARGSTGYSLLVEDARGAAVAPLYVFVGGAVKYHAWSYTLLNSYDFSGVAEAFEVLEPSTLLDKLLAEGRSMGDALAAVEEAVEQPLLAGRDVWLVVGTATPVPDGGGGSNPYGYDLVEVRAQPWISMAKHDYVLTMANNSFAKELAVLDPLSDAKWTTLRLAITAYRYPQGFTAKYMRISVLSSECGFSYTRLVRVYGWKANTFFIDFTPSAYGVSCSKVTVSIEMPGLRVGEKWFVRIVPTVFVKWSYSGLGSDSRVKKLSLGVLDDTVFYADLAGGGRDARVVYLKPLTMLSFPLTSSRSAVFAFTVRAVGGADYVYPLKVTVSIGGYAGSTVLERGSTGQVRVTVPVDVLASYFSLQEPVPVAVRVEAERPAASPGSGRVEIHLSPTAPLVLKTRTQYVVVQGRAGEDNILYTSVGRSDCQACWIWGAPVYYSGGAVALSAEDMSSSATRVFLVEARLFKQVEATEYYWGEYNYKLVIDTSYPVYGSCSSGHCRSYGPDAVRKASLRIVFPSGAVLSQASVDVREFNEEGFLPSLPALPAPLSVTLGKLGLRLVEAVVDIYSAVRWAWNLVASETASRASASIDYASRTVHVEWRKGALSPGDGVSGSVRVYGVYYATQPSRLLRIGMVFYTETGKSIGLEAYARP